MTNSRFYSILFVLQPFLTLAFAFYNRRWDLIRPLLWLYAGYYGLTVTVGSESQDSDVVRYIAEMQSLHGKNFNSISSIWYYYQSSREIDILKSLIAISVSRFTDSPNILLLIYGLIFGYFYAGNAVIILKNVATNNLFSKLLFVSFMLVMPLWSLGGFRFNTAVQIFTYGCLLHFVQKNKTGLIWCYITPLVHFSFMIPLVLLIGFNSVKKYDVRLFFLLFSLSFFVSSLNSSTFQSYIGSVGSVRLTERTRSYVDDQNVERYREEVASKVVTGRRNWYADLYRKGLKWVVILFLIILFVKRNVLSLLPYEELLNKWTLFIFSFTNLIDDIPSGGRFFALAFLTGLVLIMGVSSRNTKVSFVRHGRAISLPLLLLFIIVSIRAGFIFTSVDGVVGSPLFVWYTAGNTPELNEVLRFLIGD